MTDRIFKNWKTTLLGAVLILTGFVLVFFDKATLTGLAAFFASAMPLFFAKDKIKENFKGKSNVPVVILLLTGTMMMSSCATSRSTNVQTKETIRVDTLVKHVPVHITKVIQHTDTLIQKGDTIIIYKDRENIINTPPLILENEFAKATAGVKNNKPYLELQAKEVKIDTTVYLKQIEVLKEQIKEYKETKTITKPWWRNEWFILFIIIASISTLFILKRVFR
ncbi:MAG: hypothetical protein N4A72_14685 [Bacteroidales bacterium]|jgi:hypothetical protein|nr:hypothetical protein [Bacteroidales bacterium]